MGIFWLHSVSVGDPDRNEEGGDSEETAERQFIRTSIFLPDEYVNQSANTAQDRTDDNRKQGRPKPWKAPIIPTILTSPKPSPSLPRSF